MSKFNANQEAQFGLLPITKNERVYNLWDNSCINIGLSIATWAFLIGASLALFVGFWPAVWGTLAGNMLTVLVMTMMPCLSSAKYGMDGYSGAVSFMGVKGKNFILICVAVFIVMWDIVLSTLFARSVSNVAAAATGKEAMSHPFQVCMMLVCMLATFLVVWKGPLVIKKFNNIVAPLMIIVMIMLAAILTFKIGWGNIVKAEPLMPYESNWVNFLIAVELSFGAGLSWWPEMGGLSRLCKTSRAAYWANLVGLVLAATVATAIGAAACLTIGSEDPTVWMLQLAGVGLGVLALIFIAVANVTSCATITYTMCLGLKGLKILQERKWGAVVGGFCIIVAICLVCGADWIYDHFYIMLGVTCMFYVPMTAISAVDYMILRKQQLSLRDLFNKTSTSKYWFWGGVNWVALIIFIADALFYLVFFDPANLIYRPLFVYFTGSLGAGIPCAIIYYLVMKLAVVKTGKGAYPTLANVER